MKQILPLLMFLTTMAYAELTTPSLNTAQMQLAPGPDVQFSLDNIQSLPPFRKYKVGRILREAHTTLICVYDYATSGGANGTIGLLATDLKTPCLLPGKAIVRNAFVDWNVNPIAGTSTAPVTPTFAVSTGQTAGDLQVTVVSPAFARQQQYLMSPVFATVSTWVKLRTANSVVNGVSLNPYQPSFTIASGPLTGGHFRLFIDYTLGE